MLHTFCIHTSFLLLQTRSWVAPATDARATRTCWNQRAGSAKARCTPSPEPACSHSPARSYSSHSPATPTPIWCAFAGDAGSGVGVHGNCGDRTKWSLEHELIWGETHSKGVTGYNEVIVGRDDYESRLPQAVEAVVFTGDDRSKAKAVHAKFLGAYGLAASQVPLLHVAPVKAWYTQWGIESFEET